MAKRSSDRIPIDKSSRRVAVGLGAWHGVIDTRAIAANFAADPDHGPHCVPPTRRCTRPRTSNSGDRLCPSRRQGRLRRVPRGSGRAPDGLRRRRSARRGSGRSMLWGAGTPAGGSDGNSVLWMFWGRSTQKANQKWTEIFHSLALAIFPTYTKSPKRAGLSAKSTTVKSIFAYAEVE